MAHDFRTVAEAVKAEVKEMGKRDLNWKWKVTITKAQIRIYWSYLEYRGNTPPFIITDCPEENGNTEDDFIILNDERGYFMTGRLLGSESWKDGNLEQVVVSLLQYLQRRVNSTY